MGTIFDREPAAIAAAVRAVILLGVSFGLRWTPEQIAAVMLALEAVLAVLVRKASTPTASPSLPLGTLVSTPGGVAGVVSPTASR